MATLRRRLAVLGALTATLVGFSSAHSSPAHAADTRRFIDSVAPMARAAQNRFAVPASVSIAQSILESGWGTSTLAVNGRAYFGIKCKADNSPYQLGCMDKSSLEYFDPANPVPVVSAFRTYRSATDSFADHGYFLKNSSRYAAAFTHPSDPDGFIREVARAGYATDPGYADYIISLMRSHDLYRFDTAATMPATVSVDGAIGDRYRSLGGSTSTLSVPLGGELDGPVEGARMVTFDTGMISWSGSAGAHAMSGELWNSYRFSNNLRRGLGVATSEAYGSGGGVVQNFTGGSLVRHAGQSFPVWGEIQNAWRRLGAERGALGLPTSAEFCGLRDGGCFQRFSGGTIYWSPRTGSHPVWGAIGERWGAMRWENGALGYPTTDERCGLREGGCAQAFSGGSIYWSPASGAWSVWGAIGDSWVRAGAESSRLGYPIGAETCRTESGILQCTQQFRGGALNYRSDRGVF